MNRLLIVMPLFVAGLVGLLPVTGCKVKNKKADPKGEPAAAPAQGPAWVGTWVNEKTPFLTLTLAEGSFEKHTYNTEARKEMFTGSRGPLKVEGATLTFDKKEDYSRSMKWYKSGATTTVNGFSVEGNKLTLIFDTNKDGAFDVAAGDDAVVYVKQ